MKRERAKTSLENDFQKAKTRKIKKTENLILGRVKMKKKKNKNEMP